MPLLRPKFRHPCSCALPIFVDGAFEMQRSTLLVACATLQGLFLIIFYLFIRVPSCGDVVGVAYDSVESLSLWVLQSLSILVNLFCNKYNSSLWILPAFSVSVAQFSLLALSTHWCTDSSLLNAGLSGTVHSSLSTSLPASFPRELLRGGASTQ